MKHTIATLSLCIGLAPPNSEAQILPDLYG
jgi:hypothetical protein